MEYKEITLEQGSSAWLAWRNEGIGASDASTIMGENRFKSREELLHEKIHQINEPANAAMNEGTRLEPQAIHSVILNYRNIYVGVLLSIG